MSRERGTGHLFRKPGCKVWRMQYYVDGRRRRESTGTRDKTKANQLLVARLNSINNHEQIAPATGLLRIGALFLNLKGHYLLKRRSVPEDLGRRWMHLEPHFRDVVADRLTTDAVEDYARLRQNEGAANATINRELATLRHMMKLARETSPPKIKTAIKIRLLKEENVRTGFVEDADFSRLIEAAKELWLRTFLELGYTYGWRREELLGLRVRQVNLAIGSIRLDVGTTKNGEGREVAMTAKVRQLVGACVQNKTPEEHVLTRDEEDGKPGKPVRDMRDAWRALGVRAGLGRWECARCGKPSDGKKCSDAECDSGKHRYAGLIPHDLRRSAAKALRRAGVPESTIMAMGGWKTSAMFRRYAIGSNSDQQAAVRMLEAAREQLSPPLAPRSPEINSNLEIGDAAKTQ